MTIFTIYQRLIHVLTAKDNITRKFTKAKRKATTENDKNNNKKARIKKTHRKKSIRFILKQKVEFITFSGQTTFFPFFRSRRFRFITFTRCELLEQHKAYCFVLIMFTNRCDLLEFEQKTMQNEHKNEYRKIAQSTTLYRSDGCRNIKTNTKVK